MNKAFCIVVAAIMMVCGTAQAANRLSRQFITAPGFAVRGVVESRSGTEVFGEHKRNDLWKYYQKRLRRMRWERVGDLDAQDRTTCGGNKGGVYLKNGVSFKIQVCGAENTGFETQMNFLFYNLKPNEVVGVYVPDEKTNKF